MSIKASEISSVIKKQIENFDAKADISEVGTVLSVGVGIARIYGLDKVQACEMIELPGGIKGMVLNLETDKEVTYQIVGELEADINVGLISIASPIARSLIGKKIGDVVDVNAPSGNVEYEIVKIFYK